MPPRLVSVAILLYWVVAAWSLIRRDLLPDLRFARPPDLLSIARSVRGGGPSRWDVQVIDDPARPDIRRSVGQAITRSTHHPDGGVVLTSQVRFDPGGLLRGTAFATRAHIPLELDSTCTIDPTGNLQTFRASVRSENDPQEVLKVEGRLNPTGDALEVVTHGPLPIMNQTRMFAYQKRSLVQNAMEPFDSLPGLQVGQRWESRVVSPLTGRIETVKVEVARKTVIHWNSTPVTVLEVVQHMSPWPARTWVRTEDGLVLRQEVPFPFVKLVLDRAAEPMRPPSTEVEPER